LIVAIHNYAAFSEMFEELEEAVSFLTREGLKYGIYFIVTAINTGSIRYRLLQNFKQMYVLQLNDQSEYSGVLGNVDGVYPSKSKGRGIFKADTTYEFQTAHITSDIDNMYAFITDYCKRQRESWTQPAARRVPILPERVDAEYLRDEERNMNSNRVPVGIEKNSLKTARFDFLGSYVNVVTALQNDQCTGFIQGVAEVFAASEGRELMVLDPNQHFAAGSRQGYKYISTPAELEQTIIHLFNTLVHRNNTTKDAIEAGEQPPIFGNITCIIDSFSDVMMFLSPDGQDKLKVFLEKGNGLNVNLIISDSADKLSAISFEGWFKQQVSLSDFIWVGNGITDQYVMKIGKITNDMYQEIPQGFGYVVVKGKAALVKLLTSVESKEEEVAYHG
ncbi:MAG: type VII secretion protein EssC, partial [Mesobacillus sp.]